MGEKNDEYSRVNKKTLQFTLDNHPSSEFLANPIPSTHHAAQNVHCGYESDFESIAPNGNPSVESRALVSQNLWAPAHVACSEIMCVHSWHRPRSLVQNKAYT